MNVKQTKIFAIIIAIILILLVGCLIYSQIKESYLQEDPKLQEMKKIFEEFFRQENFWEAPLDMLNNRNIMEEISMYRGNKSYTINKEKVYICLKDDNGSYYNNNTLIFVIGHEISHSLCDEIGHTEKFHTIFEKLLLKMTEAGIYNPNIPIETDYCQDGDPELK